MRTRSRTLICFTIFFATLISGCGGGGGASVAPGTNATVVASASSTSLVLYGAQVETILTCETTGTITSIEGRCGATDAWSPIPDGDTKTCVYRIAGAYTPGCRINGTKSDYVDAPVSVIGVLKVSAGGQHTCALTAEGGVKCWGHNLSGQLGDGTSEDRYVPGYVSGMTSGIAAIASGGAHTCAITTRGSVKCWGSNYLGQLGDGSVTDRHVPVDVPGLVTGVIAISAGNTHTCALTRAVIKCWGSNIKGQLGNGSTTNENMPVVVDGLSSVVASISAGDSHTCAITTGGGLFCWGDNFYGQLGDDSIIQENTPVSVSGLSSGVAGVSAGCAHTCALTSSGGVKCWGSNQSKQLGDGTGTKRLIPVDVVTLTSGAVGVFSGQHNTCALTTAGGIKCWGWGYAGALGNGTTTDSAVPVNVTGMSSNVYNISTGYTHTCAIAIGGGIKCWGDNSYGQLGDGTTTYRTVPVDVTGL